MRGGSDISIPLGMYFSTALTLSPLSKRGKWPGVIYQYPDLQPLLSTYEKPTFALSFDDDSGFKVFVEADAQEKTAPSFDKWRNGDSLELFIDTRIALQARTKHRFFHHFVLFPEMINGISSRLFRLDGIEDNCVEVQSTYSKGKIAYDVTIPWAILDGFELENRATFGFGFRLNRTGYPPLFFPVASELLDKMPLLLATAEVSYESK